MMMTLIIFKTMANIITNLLAPAGYHLLTETEMNTIIAALGGSEVAGGKLKSTNPVHWPHPNVGATNESGFSAVCSAMIDPAGGVGQWTWNSFHWLESETDPSGAKWLVISRDSTVVQMIDSDLYAELFPRYGISVRMASDTPESWQDGDTVTDLDGNVYDLINIGGVVVTKQNWACTKYANGDDIPFRRGSDWYTAGITGLGAYTYPGDDGTLVFMEETIFTGEILDSHSAIVVFGSNDTETWLPVSGSEQWREWWDHIVIGKGVGTYKYYIVCYAARIEQSELKDLEFRIVEKFNNRLR